MDIMQSLPQGYRALVIGSSGGIGQALVARMENDARCAEVVGLSRRNEGLDITNEAHVADAAARLGAGGALFDLIFNATGALTIDGVGPEKTIRAIDPTAMLAQFAANAVGPALLLKHLSPLLPRDRRGLFASLSARVGSIGDNRLGGWISYRAAKAAQNQIIRTAAIEIARTRPDAVVVALHPGTVDTSLSAKYRGSHEAVAPDVAAANLLGVLDRLSPGHSGDFFAYDGSTIEW